MKPVLPILALTLVLTAGAAQAQPWRADPGQPPHAAAAAAERAARDQLRDRADHREATARLDQLQTETTLRRLQDARAPVLTPPPGPQILPARPTPVTGSGARTDTADRLAGMDAWIDRSR